MRRIIYTLLFSMIMIAGMFIGMVKGQEVRNKWISKMKFRYEEGKENKKQAHPGETLLDEIEEASWHG